MDQNRSSLLPAALIPRHLDAYPCLDIATVQARWHDGRRLCEWFDEASGLAGQLDVVEYGSGEVRILYSCGADTYDRQRGLALAIHQKRQVSGRTVPTVRCEPCGALTGRLYHRWQRWACQSCQQLQTRRSLLNSEPRLMLARWTLTERVHAPARPIRSLAAHDRHRFQLMAVMRQLGDRANDRLPVPLRHALKAIWFADDDKRTAVEPHSSDAPAYLDLKGDGV